MNRQNHPSSKQKTPAIEQPAGNLIGKIDDTGEHKKPGNQKPQSITEAAGVNPVKEPGDKERSHNQQDKKPASRVLQKLYDRLVHLSETPCIRARLICFHLLVTSIDVDALVWFVLAFSLIIAEAFVLVYVGNCVVRKTLLRPWQFARDLHIAGDCLDILKNNALLLTVTAVLVMVNIRFQPLAPLPFPFFFGLFCGSLCGLVMSMEHLDKRAGSLSWPRPLKERN